jgi:DNA-damage-inducible protein D
MKLTLEDINQSVFEKIKRIDDKKNEYWSARDLAKVLGYSEYRHFISVIEKAKIACINSKNNEKDHFEVMLDMIETGKGAKRQVESIALSRYAAYLVVQNADSSKEIVALGQTYFAIQTRKQEIIEQEAYQSLKSEDEKRIFLRNELKQHNKSLADAANIAGVIEPLDYAIFQDHGYMGLYGGLRQRDIHTKKNLKKSQKILDHMGSTELAANLFRATQAEEKLRRENIKGKLKANKMHYEVGVKVRKTIEELGGTMPENLPVFDSVKKIDGKNLAPITAEVDG